MKKRIAILGALALVLFVGVGFSFSNFFATEYHSLADDSASVIPLPVLNKDDYNARMLALAHYVAPVLATTTASTTSSLASTTPVTASSTPNLPFSTASTSVSWPGHLWPVPTVYPNVGALLPFNRIVAYYGNFYSKGMGVLGEYPADEMLAKLASTTALWAAADPNTPVIPAIQYIAVVAQARAGKDGKYILRMPDEEIEHAIALADQAHGIVILDVQVGKSTVEQEVPLLAKYLAMPNVHLAIDPEFSMKFGDAPGSVIGTMDAKDINFVASYLASIVDENYLPPKILVVHRFTFPMVTHYKSIVPLPEVQIVMDMDGFGSKARKYGTYNHVVSPEAVQFTGMKLFYKNDNRPPADGMLSPAEVLKLTPAPIYIQYQ